jgi:hypothetical protein
MIVRGRTVRGRILRGSIVRGRIVLAADYMDTRPEIIIIIGSTATGRPWPS